jgi:hypothetical protein
MRIGTMRHTLLAPLKASVIVILALLAGAAGAQQSGSGMQAYDVELVIFRILSGNATPEEWGTEKSLAPQQLTVPDDESPNAPAPVIAPPLATSTETFPALPPTRFKLTAVDESLKRSRNYQSLGHFGWTQPGFPRSEAHYMSIDSQVAPGLTGRVALSRGRYLHLTLDLALQGADGERFILQHTRRMRSTERHYIDHPKFGVIALITPVQN